MRSLGYRNILNLIRDLFTSKKPFKNGLFFDVAPGKRAGHQAMPGAKFTGPKD
jgi:hypothetical protein